MANLTEEDQRKIEGILLEAKGLYTAILLVKPPASLGLAIRDAKSWESLGEPEITALFSVIVALRKAALSAVPPAAAEAAPASEAAPVAPARAQALEPEPAPKAANIPIEKKKQASEGVSKSP